jgi:hypothetical protein
MLQQDLLNFQKTLQKHLNKLIGEEVRDVNKALDLLLNRKSKATSGTFTSPTEITGVSTGLPETKTTEPPLLDFQIVLGNVIKDNQSKIDQINDSFLQQKV